jgi:hypothetical protein
VADSNQDFFDYPNPKALLSVYELYFRFCNEMNARRREALGQYISLFGSLAEEEVFGIRQIFYNSNESFVDYILIAFFIFISISKLFIQNVCYFY